MKPTVALILLSLCMVSAEAARGETLYPVFGPRAAQAAPPAITAHFSGATKGKFTLKDGGGESFQGNWSFVVASFVNAKGPQDPGGYLPQPNLAFAWDAVYGQGNFLSTAVGYWMRQVVVTGDKGTTLQIECLTGPNPSSHGLGVAYDRKGNIYKVVP